MESHTLPQRREARTHGSSCRSSCVCRGLGRILQRRKESQRGKNMLDTTWTSSSARGLFTFELSNLSHLSPSFPPSLIAPLSPNTHACAHAMFSSWMELSAHKHTHTKWLYKILIHMYILYSHLTLYLQTATLNPPPPPLTHTHIRA